MNRVQRDNLMHTYNALLLQLEHYRAQAKHQSIDVSHMAGLQAMCMEWYLDEWCEDNGIQPRHTHTDGWYKP